jgi:hypothetical protein
MLNVSCLRQGESNGTLMFIVTGLFLLKALNPSVIGKFGRSNGGD